MAGARATASLSLTIGIAFSTLLIAGGILAGPAILECSKNPGSIGACLRDRFDASGLMPEAPVSSTEPAPAGWIEVNATEYRPDTIPGADLAVMPATMTGEGEALPRPAPVPVGLVRTQGDLTADGAAPFAPAAPEATPPGPRPGDLVAAAILPEAGSARALDLSGPSASIWAQAAPPASPYAAMVGADPSGVAPPDVTGSVGGTTLSAGTTLETVETAAPLLVDVPVVPVDPLPPVDPRLPPDPPPPIVSDPPPVVPGPVEPKRTLADDPRFPNVTLLPPPMTGEDSAFVTLPPN